MEIDKKILVKLIQVLEDLKKSVKGVDIKTNDNVIRRELKIFPGDIFSMKKLRESYGEVVRLNYFNSIDPQINIKTKIKSIDP